MVTAHVTQRSVVHLFLSRLYRLLRTSLLLFLVIKRMGWEINLIWAQSAGPGLCRSSSQPPSHSWSGG